MAVCIIISIKFSTLGVSAKTCLAIQYINQQNALSTILKTRHKSQFVLSANSYMFRHQGAIFRDFNNSNYCLLQQVIEGKIKGQIEVTRRRGRRRKKLLDDLKDRRGYCQLKEEALDRTMWRNRFVRGFGPVVWQITDDEWIVSPTCTLGASLTHFHHWN